MKQMRLNSRRHRLDPAEMAPACAELSPCGEGAVPLRVTGWTNRKRVWTRMEAVYPNGWVLNVYFDQTGKVSSCTSSYTLRATVPGGAT